MDKTIVPVQERISYGPVEDLRHIRQMLSELKKDVRQTRYDNELWVFKLETIRIKLDEVREVLISEKQPSLF